MCVVIGSNTDIIMVLAVRACSDFMCVKKSFLEALEFCRIVCLLLFSRHVASSGGKFFLRNAQTTYKRIPAITESLLYGVFKLDYCSICNRVTFKAQQTCGIHILIEDKDKCCFVSVTSTLPVHGTH